MLYRWKLSFSHSPVPKHSALTFDSTTECRLDLIIWLQIHDFLRSRVYRYDIEEVAAN